MKISLLNNHSILKKELVYFLISGAVFLLSLGKERSVITFEYSLEISIQNTKPFSNGREIKLTKNISKRKIEKRRNVEKFGL